MHRSIFSSMATEPPRRVARAPSYHRLRFSTAQSRKYPSSFAELAEKGILSKKTYKFDKQYEGGSTLKQAFGKEIKEGDDEATKRAKIDA